MQINYHILDDKKAYAYHENRRSEFQSIYAKLLGQEERISGRILDIGCGHGTNPTIDLIKSKLTNVDGVDPFPAVQPHPLIKNRWSCALEDLPVENNTYDLAYSYNVVEHVENQDSFLKKAVDIIKPGSVYWSMSPHAKHPFPKCVKLTQALKIKNLYRRKVQPLANDYPALYRLCDAESILGIIKKEGLAVSQIDFYYVHCVQWDTFFPKSMRIIPKLIDKLLILRNYKRSAIFMFRIQKELT